jgi:dTMP kinase
VLEKTVRPPPPLAWVSVEGVEGAGKTYLSGHLASLLGPGCVMVSEVTDHGPDTTEGRIIAALSACGDPFLRTGHPAAETLALLALKARAYSSVMSSAAPGTRLVLEDRGPDTVAVYQAAILHPSGTPSQMLHVAQQILAVAMYSRPLPDLTLLLTDEPGLCEERFAARIGRPVTPGERVLMREAARIYALLAESEPDRYAVISRHGLTSGQVLAAMSAACRRLIARKEIPCAM